MAAIFIAASIACLEKSSVNFYGTSLLGKIKSGFVKLPIPSFKEERSQNHINSNQH